MLNKHTPGEWHVGCLGSENSCKCTSILPEGRVGSIAVVTVDNGLLISDGGNDGPPEEEAIANMHLIATAPDMLDSLDFMYESLENLEGFFEDRDADGFWETLLVLKTNLKWVRKKARNKL